MNQPEIINPRPFKQGTEITLDKDGWIVSAITRKKLTVEEIISQYGDVLTNKQIKKIKSWNANKSKEE